ncbi:MarR family winged helix-turn-helix transcriptional regulator [Agromyces soli]|uniref:MarR family transcriptional regulator n=1 Tax=Agromyces soli TaxID=659012 RepID=A0ABY4APX2_9MICO|nr:MarR family transcriptional regulator [Agromyces soli]UOE25040.1 MarR family transcriptional regulator [Agromyces soli]
MTSDFTALPTWVLSSAATRSHQVLHAALARAGVNGYEYRCLSVLAAAEQLSQTELGAAAALDARDVTHTVRALEDRGLVSRERDPGHGRRQLVSLSDEGRRAAERSADVIAEVQEAVFGGLTTQERSTLLALLERLARP